MLGRGEEGQRELARTAGGPLPRGNVRWKWVETERFQGRRVDLDASRWSAQIPRLRQRDEGFRQVQSRPTLFQQSLQRDAVEPATALPERLSDEIEVGI